MEGLPGLERCKAPTAKRATALKQRQADSYWREHWQEALGRLAQSTFAQGGGEQGWRGSLDWFLRPDTVARILEGRYEDREHAGRGLCNRTDSSDGIVTKAMRSLDDEMRAEEAGRSKP